MPTQGLGICLHGHNWPDAENILMGIILKFNTVLLKAYNRSTVFNVLIPKEHTSVCLIRSMSLISSCVCSVQPPSTTTGCTGLWLGTMVAGWHAATRRPGERSLWKCCFWWWAFKFQISWFGFLCINHSTWEHRLKHSIYQKSKDA